MRGKEDEFFFFCCCFEGKQGLKKIKKGKIERRKKKGKIFVGGLGLEDRRIALVCLSIALEDLSHGA